MLKGFYETYYGAGNDRNSTAWAERVGEATPEAYAKFWYFAHGRWEGYAQGETTAQDTISAERILAERPDVLRAYYEAYYANNDKNSDAWSKRVGGETAEDYARYWYEKYGRWEGYSQSDKAAAEAIDVTRLLDERPDVFRAYYEEFYGENNDRKSNAWIDRVGGDTVEDYAKYWYVTYGQKQGYSQRPPGEEQPGGPSGPGEPSDPGPPVHDPADDPWNHPALFPDWKPPYEGWQPPPDIWHGTGGGTGTPDPEPRPEPEAPWSRSPTRTRPPRRPAPSSNRTRSADPLPGRLPPPSRPIAGRRVSILAQGPALRPSPCAIPVARSGRPAPSSAERRGRGG
ncbi:hypothetical protein [Phenylobacterium sp. J367]|uniref:hypothetical protein n=1 Tax=Phenylobacterium sp. J367 TaxID=2898435 RepID=UPI0021518D7B|nr:hypothetical protein [Phenylobacterium sp. J367]MCR5879144.1 hypothetical protein [Phenylobacterium sp. J367]